MAITAQNIADKAAQLLQDESNVRWSTKELLGWLNSGQRDVAFYKPNAVTSVGTITTVKGSKQSLPTGGIQLLDVIRTVGSKVITLVDRRVLDALIPNWHSMPEAEARHYLLDTRLPTVFYLFPPSPGGEVIEAAWARRLTDLAAMNDVIFDDLYESALVDYVLYRAYSKDVEHTASQQRADMYQQLFMTALQGKTSAEIGLAPAPSRAVTNSERAEE